MFEEFARFDAALLAIHCMQSGRREKFFSSVANEDYVNCFESFSAKIYELLNLAFRSKIATSSSLVPKRSTINVHRNSLASNDSIRKSLDIGLKPGKMTCNQ